MLKFEENLPEDWEINKFKFEFTTQKGLSITKDDLIDEGIPVINYGQIHSQKGISVNTAMNELPFVASSYLKKNRKALMNYGDFVFADTSEDIVGSGNFKMNVSVNRLFAGYHTIIARLKKDYVPRYFMYLFESDWFREQIRESVSGVKVFSITQLILKNTKIILPSIQEQKVIVNFLDDKVTKLDRAIELLEQEIEKLEEYKNSFITEVINENNDTLHYTKLKYISKIKTGTTPKDNEGIVYNTEKSINWFTPGDYSNGDLLDGAEKFILEQSIKYNNYKIFPQNSTLIVGIGATVGKTGFSESPSFSNQQITALSPQEGILGKFLFYLILSKVDFIKGNALYTTLPIINNQYLGNIKVQVPDLDRQKRIIDILDSKIDNVNGIIKIKKRQLSKIIQVRKSLIFEYVTGKTRVI